MQKTSFHHFVFKASPTSALRNGGLFLFYYYFIYFVLTHLFLDKHLLWLKRYAVLNTLQTSHSLIALSLHALFAKLLTTAPGARGLCLAGEQNQLFIIPLILLISY